jgi:hypothetical protein
MRSCAPFCCGELGSISSGVIPSRIHQALSARGAQRCVANGTPLSLRMRLAGHTSEEPLERRVRTPVVSTLSNPRHARR